MQCRESLYGVTIVMKTTERYPVSDLQDKLCLFASSFCFSLLLFPVQNLVAPLLMAVTIVGFLTYLENTGMRIGLMLLFPILCFAFPPLTIYSPTIAYEGLHSRQQKILPLLLLAIQPLYVTSGWEAVTMVLAATITGLLLKHRTCAQKTERLRYYDLLDESRQLHARLESRQQQLLEQQDAGINLATMNERNRIARDIHDNVGHLLSSALLQTAALRTTAKHSTISQSLEHLQNTLDEGLHNIRNSVHHLHETSINLEQYIHKLLTDYTWCETTCSIELYSPISKEIKYAVISIVKESLANTMKHSDARLYTLRLKEHPGFYQLIITDNGTQIDIRSSHGIGLRNIHDRISQLQGQVRISGDKGFRLFITIPKGA